MSIPKSTAKANTTVTHDAAVLAANNYVISNMDIQIAEAIAMGVFWISTHITNPTVDIRTVAQHYVDLGYGVKFTGINPGNPAALFGECWVYYWDSNGIPTKIPSNAKIKVIWS